MGNEIQARLAENIKTIRKEKHLTQFELAERANISEAMVKSIETCHAWPSENTLLQLSSALETDIYRFFMPVSASLPVKENLRKELTAVIKARYCDFLRETMHSLE